MLLGGLVPLRLKGKIAEYKRYREVVDNTLKKLKLEADTTQEERNILLEENETLRKKMNVQNRQLSSVQLRLKSSFSTPVLGGAYPFSISCD